jgi:hypothetical protein
VLWRSGVVGDVRKADGAAKAEDMLAHAALRLSMRVQAALRHLQ